MQSNDSRLIKAAKRTIRAEVTLVIVILVIASWSVYALYKLSMGGSDTLFGLSLTKLATAENGHPKNSTTSSPSSFQIKSTTSTGSNNPIYLPDAAASPFLQSDQLRRIQHLLASQDPNRRLLANGLLAPINSPLTGSLTSPSTYNPNLIHHLANSNARHGAQLTEPTSAQLRAPPANNLYVKAVMPHPIGSLPPTYHRGGDIDYESNYPDYGPPRATDSSSLDYSGDRQAEESNRDPGESVVENFPTTAPDEDQDSTQVLEDSSEAKGDDLSSETTTTPSPESDSETSPDADTNIDQPAIDDHDKDEQSQGSATEEEEPVAENNETVEPENEESLKAAGLSIDEEVDRMTQPSLGSVSQQDRPINFNKDTVQFDDSPNPSMRDSKRRFPPRERGTLVAQFADPQVHSGHKRRANIKGESDLQVDHDTVQVGSVRPEKSYVKHIELMRVARRRKKEDTTSKPDNKRVTTNSRRQKRHLAENVIRAPYEIDGFLNSLDVDEFIERSFEQPTQTQPRGRSRAIVDNRTPEISLDSAPSETVSKRIGPDRGENKKMRGSLKGGLMRRSDEEEEEDDDSGEGQNEEGDAGGGAGEEDENGTDSSPARSHRSGGRQLDPRYHYITSNDTTLRDLLTRQHLLDALRNSQLPSPARTGQSDQLNQTTGAMANASVAGQQQQQVTLAADHQPAGSLYSVDHGLLLYPASNDEYSSKSMSKKKKRHEKKKEKKKMTVAVKKGGHKKKKHKKEEKKFMKEKKFKGAKKGKKVSKGKGGQGGKKGKKLYKDKGFKKKGFKNVYHKEEFGQKKSYFDEFRDKDFKKKWKKFDDKYNYAQMKKWQAKDVKGAKKMKDHGEKFKKYDKGKWKKKYHKESKENSESSKKHKKSDGF